MRQFVIAAVSMIAAIILFPLVLVALVWAMLTVPVRTASRVIVSTVTFLSFCERASVRVQNKILILKVAYIKASPTLTGWNYAD